MSCLPFPHIHSTVLSLPLSFLVESVDSPPIRLLVHSSFCIKNQVVYHFLQRELTPHSPEHIALSKHVVHLYHSTSKSFYHFVFSLWTSLLEDWDGILFIFVLITFSVAFAELIFNAYMFQKTYEFAHSIVIIM